MKTVSWWQAQKQHTTCPKARAGLGTFATFRRKSDVNHKTENQSGDVVKKDTASKRMATTTCVLPSGTVPSETSDAVNQICSPPTPPLSLQTHDVYGQCWGGNQSQRLRKLSTLRQTRCTHHLKELVEFEKANGIFWHK